MRTVVVVSIWSEVVVRMVGCLVCRRREWNVVVGKSHFVRNEVVGVENVVETSSDMGREVKLESVGANGFLDLVRANCLREDLKGVVDLECAFTCPRGRCHLG